MASPRKPPTQLDVEPGAPPPSGDEPQLDEPAALVDEPAAPGVVEQVEQWEQETVELLIGAMCMGLHLTLGRGGPEDAFIPTPSEKGEMASPATRLLNRSLRARAIAKYGDGVAFLTTTGSFVVSEAERTAAYRAGNALDEPPPDEGLEGLGTIEQREGVRPWRPPAPPES